jgi:hypothetical protein
MYYSIFFIKKQLFRSFSRNGKKNAVNSRFSVILSRAIVVLPFTLAPYLAYALTSTLVFVFANGFGAVFSITDLITRLLLFVLQVMAIQSISMFIMFACKKSLLGMTVLQSRYSKERARDGFGLIYCTVANQEFERDNICPCRG